MPTRGWRNIAYKVFRRAHLRVGLLRVDGMFQERVSARPLARLVRPGASLQRERTISERETPRESYLAPGGSSSAN